MPNTVRILGTHGVPAAYGGFETAAEHIGLHLVAQGWRVIVYCQVEGRGAITNDLWRGLERVHIPEHRRGGLGTSSFDLKSIRHAVQHHDVCLTFGYNTGVFNALQRFHRIPNVINMDGMEWKRARWGMARQGILLANERFAARVGNHLIADHPEIERYLLRQAPARKVAMITYGAHAVHHAPVGPVTDLGLTPGRYLTAICRPIRENSLVEIVTAFSRRPRGQQLVVVGDHQPHSDEYHRRVAAAAGQEVVFPGAIYDPQVVRALRFHSSAYLHGHTVGGTNPSLVEAMAAGNPVIAHDNVYNRWVAGPEQRYFSGMEDLAEALDTVLASTATLASMGEASRRRHGEEFTWERIAGQYEALLGRYVAPTSSEGAVGSAAPSASRECS